MDLLTKIISCKEEELKEVINGAVIKIIQTSEQKEKLGFVDVTTAITLHKGFINPDTKIQYSKGSVFNYSMKTTDFYYEFAKYIKKIKINNIGNLIKEIETFINYYFGVNKDDRDNRDDYLFSITLGATSDDDEAWDKINNLEIGNFKGKRVAMCTEKASLAQNLISLFGIESYWCMGYLNNDGKIEPHCFNIARAKNSYILLDYSVPCQVIQDNKVNDWAPFQGEISLSELEEILNGKPKEYINYTYSIKNNQLNKIYNDTTRTYEIDNYQLNKNKSR